MFNNNWTTVFGYRKLNETSVKSTDESVSNQSTNVENDTISSPQIDESITKTSELTLAEWMDQKQYTIKTADGNKIESAESKLPASFFGIESVLTANSETDLRPYEERTMNFADQKNVKVYGIPQNLDEIESEWPFLASTRYLITEKIKDSHVLLVVDKLEFKNDSCVSDVANNIQKYNSDFLKFEKFKLDNTKVYSNTTNIHQMIRQHNRTDLSEGNINYSLTKLNQRRKIGKDEFVKYDFSSPYTYLVPKDKRGEDDQLRYILAPLRNIVNISKMFYLGNDISNLIVPKSIILGNKTMKFTVSSKLPKKYYEELTKKSSDVLNEFDTIYDITVSDINITFIEKLDIISKAVSKVRTELNSMKVSASNMRKYQIDIMEEEGILREPGYRKARNDGNTDDLRRISNQYFDKNKDGLMKAFGNPSIVVASEEIEVFKHQDYSYLTETEYNKIVSNYYLRIKNIKFRFFNINIDVLIKEIKSYYTPPDGFLEDENSVVDQQIDSTKLKTAVEDDNP
jgi:hypothetical protein